MTDRRVLVGLASAALTVIGVVAAWSSSAAIAEAQAQPAPDGQRYALLVGVTEFIDPQMARHNLKGPANDVSLFRSVLTAEPFHLPADNIISLAGPNGDAARRPTRANIEREFTNLRNRARPGDQVIVLLAGHGSQQPARPDPGDVEPDGLDEIFLPADASGWDGMNGHVRGAIVDDDIRTWVTAIRQRGAFVWLIVDSCQSGTMMRGAMETFRQIEMADLGIPPELIELATKAGDSARGVARAPSPLAGFSDSVGGVAALYASQPYETTPEKPLPGPGNAVHGLFTYTIASLLKESRSPLTYRELAFRVLERYRTLRGYGPTPMFEGGGLDRELLGQRTWPDRPSLLLGTAAEKVAGWTLEAGGVHGLNVGTVLELFPPAGSRQADRSVGFLRVVRVQAITAIVEPTPYDGRTAPAASVLEPGSRARVAEHAVGDLRLRLALDTPTSGSGTQARFRVVPAGQGPVRIEAALSQLTARSRGLAVRVDSDDADWYVRESRGRIVLVPAAGWIVADGGPEVPRGFDLGPSSSPSLGEDLGDSLRRIARARNLMRLAVHSATDQLKLRLRVTRYDTAEGGRGTSIGGVETTARPGQYLEFEVGNEGPRSVDVTVLHLDPAFGIQSLYPRRDEEGDNRFGPGETRSLGRFLVTDTATGWEHALAIGVLAGSVRQSFSWLAQDSLAGTPDVRGWRSPLSALFEAAAFGGDTGTRGLTTTAGRDPFVIRMATWRTDFPRK